MPRCVVLPNIDGRGYGFTLREIVRGILFSFLHLLRAKAGTAGARLSHRNSVRLSVRPSVCHTGGSVKNSAS